jgi:phospho-N-acetylmuramoyl-pentapeptide-transferase
MLYYLFDYLENNYQLPGASLFQFLTFRASLAVILSLIIATVYGKKIIRFLQKKQVGETVRDLGLEGQSEKAGTPTMGGVIGNNCPSFAFCKVGEYLCYFIIGHYSLDGNHRVY